MRFKGFRGWAAQKPDSHRGSTGRRDRVKWNGVWRALGAGQSEEMKNRSRAELHTENWAIYIFASDAAIYKGRGWKGWGKNKPEPIILESRKNTSIRCFFFFIISFIWLLLISLLTFPFQLLSFSCTGSNTLILHSSDISPQNDSFPSVCNLFIYLRFSLAIASQSLTCC